jgi:threonylcarbamoyladenosine tRNA methylthiotransferase MtaB
LIREYFEHPAITTDVIVGFPQETETEFEETCAFVQKVNFAEIHVFKYSRRKGTKADAMEGQVADQVKTQRSHRLMEIAGRMHKEYLSWYLGRQVEILTEDTVSYDGKNWRCGHTKEYVKCLLEDCESNKIITAEAIELTENSVLLTKKLENSWNNCK